MLVGYLLWKVVPVKIATSEFYDVMQEQAAFASIKDVKNIEFEILRRAEELKIPVKKDNLKITKQREMITVEAHYEIDDRLLQRGVQVRLEVRSGRAATALLGVSVRRDLSTLRDRHVASRCVGSIRET